MKTIQVKNNWFAISVNFFRSFISTITNFFTPNSKLKKIKPKLTVNGFTEEEEDEILRIEKDALAGKNVYGPFDTVEEMFADLQKR